MLAQPCAREQTPSPLSLSLYPPPTPPFLPQLCVLMSVVPFATSVCDNGSLWSVLFQCGSQPSALEEDALNWAMSARRGGEHKGFLLNILYRSAPMATGTKESTSTGRVGAFLILPSRHHPASTRLPLICPAVLALCTLSSSLLSIGQVQSESLAELRLSLILSPKAASFIWVNAFLPNSSIRKIRDVFYPQKIGFFTLPAQRAHEFTHRLGVCKITCEEIVFFWRNVLCKWSWEVQRGQYFNSCDEAWPSYIIKDTIQLFCYILENELLTRWWSRMPQWTLQRCTCLLSPSLSLSFSRQVMISCKLCK